MVWVAVVLATQQPALFGHTSRVDVAAQPWVTSYALGIREETFGQLLRRLRLDAGFRSQEAFAEAVALSHKTIQTIEGARNRPKIKGEVAVVTRMAAALGVPVSVLSAKLGWVPIEEAQATSWERGLDDSAKQIVTKLAEHLRERKADDPPATIDRRRAARS